jgi:ketosteroid isomerase-like protein
VKALGVRQATLTTVEAMPAGDSIVEIGKAELDTPGGPASLKYVVFWKEEDGRWKWHVDIWNAQA